jgi:competence protein ComGC
MVFLKLSKKIKGNSIIESVISMTIISICLGLAFLIYANIIKQNNSIAYYNATNCISKLLNETIQFRDYSQNTYKFEKYSITKKTTIKKTSNIVLITWTINTSDKTYTEKNLISYEEE